MNGIAAIVGAALLVGYLIFDGRLRVGAAARSTVPGAEDRGSSLRLSRAYGVSMNVFVLSALLAFAGILALPTVLAWVGVALVLAGIALRTWSVRVLGASYTRTLRTSAEQHIVRSGPYGVVRHPGYTGSVLMWTGLALSSGALLGVAVIVPLIVWAYLRRIEAEDAMLVARFGDEYATYAREVRRLVPFVF